MSPPVPTDHLPSSTSAVPTRVLLVEVNEDGTTGGSHQCLFDIARSLDPARFTPIVLFYQDNRFAPALAGLGIRTIVWDDVRRGERGPAAPFRRAKQIAQLVAAVRRRIQLLRAERIDILHMNSAPGLAFDDWLLAAKLRGIPAIAHARLQFAMPRRALWRALVRRFDVVVAISQEMQRFLVAQGIPRQRITLIYDGIDAAALRARVKRARVEMRRSLGVGPDQVLVAMVGHLRPWKGQDVVLRALDQVPSGTRQRLRLVFAGGEGQGNERYIASLHAAVGRSGFEQTVTFLGERDDVPEIMNAADIVVHASTTPEPFGLVVVEGMALGRAVIAAALGGPLETIAPGTGLLVDPTRPDLFAEQLTRLANDPLARASLGQRAREHAERFSVRANVSALEQLYATWAAGNAPAGAP